LHLIVVLRLFARSGPVCFVVWTDHGHCRLGRTALDTVVAAGGAHVARRKVVDDDVAPGSPSVGQTSNGADRRCRVAMRRVDKPIRPGSRQLKRSRGCAWQFARAKAIVTLE